MKRFDFSKKFFLIKLARKRGLLNLQKRTCRLLKQKNNSFSINEKKRINRNSNIRFYKSRIESINRKKDDKLKNIETFFAPTNFSFLENCEETCKFFEKMATRSINNKVKKIVFDQSKCTNIDLCAESLAAVLLKDISKEEKMTLCGTYPENPYLKHIVRASGVTKYLRITNDCPEDMIIFDMKEGKKTPVKPNSSTQKELLVPKLIDHLDKCLNKCDYKLKKEGKSYLANIINEVLDNAECHSKRPTWWINAYLRTIGENKGECQLVIFNLGRSIYESMQDLSPDDNLRKQIESLVAEHSKKKFFTKSWDAETLWTLYSLQEGVTRLSEKYEDRGQGLSDLIEFFQIIGKSKGKNPAMTLVSGYTFIRFDQEYKITKTKNGVNSRRQIAFNKDNDLHKPPDARKILKLEHFFPGTICSFKFYIDKQYLENLKNG